MNPRLSKPNKKESTTDVLFYSVVTVLGVGLTSLCVYGYRKYQEYNRYDEEKLQLEEIVTDFSNMENTEDLIYNEVVITEIVQDPPYMEQLYDQYDNTSTEAIAGDPLREHFED